MKLLRKLAARFGGRYKRKERAYAPVAHDRIIEILADNGFADSRLSTYLDLWPPYLAKQKRWGDLAVFFGSKRARKILGIRKDELEPPQDTLHQALLAWFDPSSGCFDFNGIRLVPPRNEADAKLFIEVFNDILLSRLLGDGRRDIADGISAEGDYEHGDFVRLEPGDLVVDAGANMGMFSALAGARKCRVLAFEPSGFIRKTYLDANAAMNGDITVFPYALSDVRDLLSFFCDYSNIGASIRADGKRDSSGLMANGELEEVEAITLDEFVEEHGIGRIDFIKADIEGSERRLLLGARKILAKHAPKLSICTYHLPDDPMVLRRIILESQPRYTIHQGDCKLYAHVEGR